MDISAKHPDTKKSPINQYFRRYLTPYPGCRLVIANVKKFESLPENVKAVVMEVFELIETPDKQMQQMNDAILQELVVSGE